MDVSWSAIFVLATLITPSLPFIFFLRLTFPKIVLASQKETLFLLTGCLVSITINIGTIGDVAQMAVKNLPDGEVGAAMLKELFHATNFKPIMPVHFIAKLFGKQLQGHNLLGFFLNLHVTSFLAGFLLWFGVTLLGYIEKFFQYLPYNTSFVQEITDYRRYYHCINDLEQSSTYKIDLKSRRSLFNRILNYFRGALYHPWALLTQTNRWRELLMADIFHENGELYSGLFTSYVSDGDDVSALALEYVIKYSPSDPQNPKDGHPKKIIPNNGELVIPMNKICTVHFWEIRKGFKCNILLKNASSVEILKWYLLLGYLFPGFVQHISVAVEKKNISTLNLINTDLNPWLKQNRIVVPPQVLGFSFV